MGRARNSQAAAVASGSFDAVLGAGRGRPPGDHLDDFKLNATGRAKAQALAARLDDADPDALTQALTLLVANQRTFRQQEGLALLGKHAGAVLARQCAVGGQDLPHQMAPKFGLDSGPDVDLGLPSPMRGELNDKLNAYAAGQLFEDLSPGEDDVLAHARGRCNAKLRELTAESIGKWMAGDPDRSLRRLFGRDYDGMVYDLGWEKPEELLDTPEKWAELGRRVLQRFAGVERKAALEYLQELGEAWVQANPLPRA